MIKLICIKSHEEILENGGFKKFVKGSKCKKDKYDPALFKPIEAAKESKANTKKAGGK